MKALTLLLSTAFLAGCSSLGLNAIIVAAKGLEMATQQQTPTGIDQEAGPFTLVSSSYDPKIKKTHCGYRNVYGKRRAKDYFGEYDCPYQYRT